MRRLLGPVLCLLPLACAGGSKATTNAPAGPGQPAQHVREPVSPAPSSSTHAAPPDDDIVDDELAGDDLLPPPLSEQQQQQQQQQQQKPPPQPVDVPAKIPTQIRTKALSITNLDPSLLDSTMIGGMPQPDGSAHVRHSRAGTLGLTLKVGAKPRSFASVELFVRPVELSGTERPKPSAVCGGKNATYDSWKAAGPVTQLQVGSVAANHAVWDLEAAANAELEIYFVLVGDQFPGGYFTYIAKFTERDGREHWVESAAIQLEIRQCAAP